MSVLVLEAKDCASPLFLVRMWALLCGCLTFSLVATLEHEKVPDTHLNTFWIACMFTWCFFFTLTLLIHILNTIRFHSLLPVSWKNLTVTAATLGAFMTLSASVLYFWLVMNRHHLSARPMVAAAASCLTVLAYCGEMWVIRSQSEEQRGYMASLAGCLKIVQCWGGCQTIPLFVERIAAAAGRNVGEEHAWQLWLSSAVNRQLGTRRGAHDEPERMVVVVAAVRRRRRPDRTEHKRTEPNRTTHFGGFPFKCEEDAMKSPDTVSW
ncbi:hypothetical protein CRUP_023694 [Coryphaenoides rupestris]|nr:hypothetical protein CRUP_023694 [Coryphaenoides rupestris]